MPRLCHGGLQETAKVLEVPKANLWYNHARDQTVTTKLSLHIKSMLTLKEETSTSEVDFRACLGPLPLSAALKPKGNFQQGSRLPRDEHQAALRQVEKWENGKATGQPI